MENEAEVLVSTEVAAEADVELVAAELEGETRGWSDCEVEGEPADWLADLLAELELGPEAELELPAADVGPLGCPPALLVLALVLALVGGPAASWLPELPTGRVNVRPLPRSTITIVLTGAAAGATLTTAAGWKDGHALPVKTAVPCATGGSSGLPQAQRALGTPRLSTSTAVPACRMDWKLVAAPLAKPWLVTRVSIRSTTGVSECR